MPERDMPERDRPEDPFREAQDLVRRLIPEPGTNDPYLSNEVAHQPSEAEVRDVFPDLRDAFERMEADESDRFFAWFDAYVGQQGGLLNSLIQEYRRAMSEAPPE